MGSRRTGSVLPTEVGASGGGLVDSVFGRTGDVVALVADYAGLYVRLGTADTVTAKHSFSPGAPDAPFALGANALNQLVTGLNADKLDGSDASAFAASSHTHAAADVVSGQLGLARGGTGADLSAAGGSGYLVRQNVAGGVFTAARLILTDLDDTLVTYAKIQNVSATDKVLGRFSALAGVIEEIACTAAGRAVIDDVDAAAQRTTLGLGTIATFNDAPSDGTTYGRLNGAWAAAGGGGGANTALSNLAAVAVSLALTPGTDNSIALNSAAKRYTSSYYSTDVQILAGVSDANPTAKLSGAGLYGGAGGLSTVDASLLRSAAGEWTAQKDSIGATQGAYGLALVNATAAAAGAQQVSPPLRWRGFGWKTNATAASQSVDFRSYVVPIEGASAPTGELRIEASINGAAYGTRVAMRSDGAVRIGTAYIVPANGNLVLQWAEAYSVLTVASTNPAYSVEIGAGKVSSNTSNSRYDFLFDVSGNPGTIRRGAWFGRTEEQTVGLFYGSGMAHYDVYDGTDRTCVLAAAAGSFVVKAAASRSDAPAKILNSASAVLGNPGGTHKVDTTAGGNVGIGEDTLVTYTSPADLLAINGEHLVIEAAGTFAANVNAKTVKLYYGATVLFSASALFNGTHWHIRALVLRTGAATQDASAQFSGDTNLVTQTATYTEPAETLSGTVVIKVTGEATADNDIVCKFLRVAWHPAA